MDAVTCLSASGILAAPARAVSGRLHDTFDGFQTLKLLHVLRDRGLAEIPLREALLRASFVPLSEEVKTQATVPLARQIEALDHRSPDSATSALPTGALIQ